jgi:hypothetical protein
MRKMILYALLEPGLWLVRCRLRILARHYFRALEPLLVALASQR